MINLFVDDVRECPYIGWQVVRTIADARVLLATGTVKHLSLDHDMGACSECVAARRDVGDMLTPETTFVSWCPHAEDGSALVRWMIETGNWSKTKPVVHSMNPVGAARMRGLIERYWPGDHEQSS
jgi:hypothetical protein